MLCSRPFRVGVTVHIDHRKIKRRLTVGSSAATFNGMKRTRIYAYVKPNLKVALDKYAKDIGDSASEVIEEALKVWLEVDEHDRKAVR